MITLSSLLHTAKSADSYAYDKETLHIRLKTRVNEIKEVSVWIGDPYQWEEGGLDGGNLGGGDAHGWSGGNEISMLKEGQSDLYDHWFVSYKPPKRRTRYGFILYGTNGEKVLFGERRCIDISLEKVAMQELSNISNFFCFPYINPVDVLTPPAWVKETIWYQIFPERFSNGNPAISPENVEPWGSAPTANNFMGGDLQGIIDKLDYLQDLGINGLYLCPIFTANANHKYDTVNYFNVDPHFGDNETFKELVSAAHKRGMKVMLDAVFNHIGNHSPLWLDVVKNGKESPYANWFWINKFPVYPEKIDALTDYHNFHYETFGNVIEMPKLNTENEDCRNYLLNVAKFWIEEFDIDGWRLDVANEVDHEFWRSFRKVVKGLKPECYILGEIWHEGMPWLRGDQFDSLMNYPLMQTIIDYFSQQVCNKETFMSMITNIYCKYPQNVNEVMFNLLESHDTSRLLSLCDDDKRKAKLAYLFMFTQVGSPCIYYGSEIGLTGLRTMGSEDNRKCMIWDKEKQDLDMYRFFQTLIFWRKNNKDWRSSDLQWINTEHQSVIAYVKETTYFFLNNSNETVTIQFMDKDINLTPFGYYIFNISGQELASWC
ncbi:alpha-glycosidase [Klebsiella pneumoniae]|mgnify:FL=1|nr:alpha-glycosidase [Klebsiella pneumoniae]HBR2700676.1 alpha-glycosidase [Klebsiella pneumoniae]HCM2979385.1 alpha-glycosidase [Klebsiella pneumoniae]